MTGRPKAEAAMAEIFTSFVSRFSQLSCFFATGLQSSNVVSDALRDQESAALGKLVGNTELDGLAEKLYPDLNTSGFDEVVDRLAHESLAEFRWTLGASVLVLSHSMADDVLARMLEVCATLEVAGWLEHVGRRQVTLSEALSDDRRGLVEAAAMQYLKQGIPLHKKSALLEALCPLESLQATSFGRLSENDRARLKKIDGMRNQLVHGDALLSSLPLPGDDHEFLRDLCIYHYELLVKSHSVVPSDSALVEQANRMKHLRERAGFRKFADFDLNELIAK